MRTSTMFVSLLAYVHASAPFAFFFLESSLAPSGPIERPSRLDAIESSKESARERQASDLHEVKARTRRNVNTIKRMLNHRTTKASTHIQAKHTIMDKQVHECAQEEKQEQGNRGQRKLASTDEQEHADTHIRSSTQSQIRASTDTQTSKSTEPQINGGALTWEQAQSKHQGLSTCQKHA